MSPHKGKGLTMKAANLVSVAIALSLLGQCLLAEEATSRSALARMPVKEVSVFKDGHAVVLHEGKMPTDASGNVVMDYLPTPVLGAFWPFCAQEKVKLSAVVASQHKVAVERTSLNVKELIEANIGKEVIIYEVAAGREAQSHEGAILDVPQRSSRELEATSPPNSPPMLPQKGSVVLLNTAEGVKAIPMDRIATVTFKGDVAPKLAVEEFRNLLTLKLDWPGGKPAKQADVGLLYVQKGLRWIPNYKLDLDGKGQATVRLQATLINELTDLEDATVHLVVGVPTFAMQDKLDPMALGQTVAQLSEHFRREMSGPMSNVIMGQAMSYGSLLASAPSGDLGPEVGPSERKEDLFVFTVEHVTLKKGQRMALPVNEVKMPYKDVYVLNVPGLPPPEVWREWRNREQFEAARLAARPKVMHTIRLSNKGKCPFTTAPVLITRDDKVIAQGMVTYTAAGADVDIEVTAAVDISVTKTENELKRTPSAAVWQGQQYGRVDLAGTIKLTNRRDQDVDLEITRVVLGNVESADHDGKVEMVNVLEEDDASAARLLAPYRSEWPHWWGHFNSVSRITWTLPLKAGQTVELNYKWNYFVP